MYRNVYKVDIINFFLLFIASIISVYYLSPVLNKIFFLILLIPIWFTKKDYFWFMHFLILRSEPFRLFNDFSNFALHRIPSYEIAGGYGLEYYELFLILFFIKALCKGNSSKLVLHKEYKMMLILLIFQWIMTIIYGFDNSRIISYIRLMLYYTLFYSVPKLIRPQTFFFMFRIMVIFTFVIVLNQLLTVIFHVSIGSIIQGGEIVNESINQGQKYIRLIDSVNSQFFVFVFGFVLLSFKHQIFKNRYLYASILMAFISIVLTGTRGWIIGFSISIIYYLFVIEKFNVKKLLFFTIFFLIFVIVISQNSIINEVFDNILTRLSTVNDLAKGDLSAGGSLLRLTVRLPKLLIGLKQNPIFGWSFSEMFSKYRDQHIGWFNQILEVGFLGLFVYIVFWYKFWKNNINMKVKIFKKSTRTLNIGLLLLFAIHSTSRTMFNFIMQPSILTLVIMFFLFSDMWYKIALEYEEGVLIGKKMYVSTKNNI